MLKARFLTIFLTLFVAFTETSIAEDKDDESLFFIFSLSEEGQQDLSFDHAYFFNESSPKLTTGSDQKAISRSFIENIDFVTDSSVKGHSSGIRSVSLLDDSFKLILYDENAEIKIDDKQPPGRGSQKTNDLSSGVNAFIHLSDSSSIAHQLTSHPRSAYRLGNLLGLSEAARHIKNEESPIAYCQDLIGSPYTCDRGSEGPFKTTGKVLLHYAQQCQTCNEADSLILNMAAAHHLLRSGDSRVREMGEELMLRYRRDFEYLDMSYQSLNDIYLKSLSLK